MAAMVKDQLQAITCKTPLSLALLPAAVMLLLLPKLRVPPPTRSDKSTAPDGIGKFYMGREIAQSYGSYREQVG